MDKSIKWKERFEIKPGTWIFVPSEETALTGLAIKENIEENWSPPYYYYNHRDGGHIAAIKAHIGNDLFSKLDLKKFFNQINKSRITRNLKEI